MPPRMMAADSGDDGEGLSLLTLLEEWGLIESDFQRHYGADLDAARHSMTWRRFLVLLGGLFGIEDSLTRHHFRPSKDETPTTPEE